MPIEVLGKVLFINEFIKEKHPFRRSFLADKMYYCDCSCNCMFTHNKEISFDWM